MIDSDILELLKKKNKKISNGSLQIVDIYEDDENYVVAKDNLGTYRVLLSFLLKGGGIHRKAIHPNDFCRRTMRMKESRGLSVSVTLTEHYELYAEQFGYNIKMPKYRSILMSILKKVWLKMFEDNWRFNVPCGFGQIYPCLMYEKPNTIHVLWSSGEGGRKEKTPTLNLHTNGRRYYMKWYKYTSKIKYKSFYIFKATRGRKREFWGKRGLAGWIEMVNNDPYKEDFKGHIL